MPKKLPDDQMYDTAFSPVFSFEPALKARVDAYYAQNPNASGSDWRDFIRATACCSDNPRSLVWESKLVLNCWVFFEKYNPLPKDFVIFNGNSACFTQEQSKDIQAALDEDRPFYWGSYQRHGCDRFVPGGTYLFGNSLWLLTQEDMAANADELRLLFLEAVDQTRNKFERLKRKFSGLAGDRIVDRRESIPENVKIYVWRRDEGKCVQCGSQERLEYDHVIPVIKGGSSTERNIQLLCEGCNRKKSARI